MNKELTPLEALEKITNYKCSRMSEKIECKEIVEAALKALEIIKEKWWLVSEVIESKGNFQLYKEWCKIFGADMKYRASKEEFDLLREVLLNETQN